MDLKTIWKSGSPFLSTGRLWPAWIVLFILFSEAVGQTGQDINSPLIVRKCKDFAITGKGSDVEWSKAEWNQLIKLDDGGKPNVTRFKILYSSRGIYVLFQ